MKSDCVEMYLQSLLLFLIIAERKKRRVDILQRNDFSIFLYIYNMYIDIYNVRGERKSEK